MNSARHFHHTKSYAARNNFLHTIVTKTNLASLHMTLRPLIFWVACPIHQPAARVMGSQYTNWTSVWGSEIFIVVDGNCRHTLSTQEHIAERQQHQSRQKGPCSSARLAPINPQIQLGTQKKRHMPQKARASLYNVKRPRLEYSMQVSQEKILLTP